MKGDEGRYFGSPNKKVDSIKCVHTDRKMSRIRRNAISPVGDKGGFEDSMLKIHPFLINNISDN